jgi:hypothetical protein
MHIHKTHPHTPIHTYIYIRAQNTYTEIHTPNTRPDTQRHNHSYIHTNKLMDVYTPTPHTDNINTDIHMHTHVQCSQHTHTQRIKKRTFDCIKIDCVFGFYFHHLPDIRQKEKNKDNKKYEQ